MTKIKKYSFLTIIIVGLLILFLGRDQFFKSEKNDSYRVEKAKLGDITQTVSANGTLNPVTLVNVGSQVSGTVQKIYADFNDNVTAGQILLEIDPTLFKAIAGQSQAQVIKAKAALDLARANQNRGEPLVAHGDISKQDWDSLIQATKAATADLALASAKLENDKANLSYTVIRSPISGVVVDREVDVGQTVAASFQTPTLYKIAQDLRKMQIDSSFAEADIGNIRTGQDVTFTVDAFPNQTFKAIVKQIRLNPTTQQNVVTYDVVITVDNPEGLLLPGMTAYVNIKTAEKKNVMLVPNSAFRYKPKNEKPGNNTLKITANSGKLYKLIDHELKPTVCSTGITDNSFTEITKCDLTAGDEVVIGDKNGAAAPTSGFRLRVF